MNTAIAVDPPKSSLALALVELEAEEPTAAVMLRAAFEEMFDNADEWAKRAASIRVTGEDQVREMKLARETRLALREIRVKGEKARKRLKENIVRQGKAIDGIANVLKALIEPLEEKLLIDETFAERAEDVRQKALAESRSAALTAYGVDPTTYVNLGVMAAETWETTLETAKRAHEQRLAEAKKQEDIRLEAERIAAERAANERKEAARVEAERIERERVQAEENAKLKAEAEARELEAKAEREKHAAEIKAKDEAAAAELARQEAEVRAKDGEVLKERAKAEEARLAKEKAELDAKASRETLERAEREGADRVAREKADEQAKAEAAALAPDKEKLRTIAARLRAFDLPTFTTAKGKAASKNVSANFEKLAAWLEKTAGEL